MIKTILATSTWALLFSGCIGGSDEKEAWTLYIYPDKDNTKRTMIIPAKFNSLKSCRKASVDVLKQKGLMDTGTYKCGKNCEYHEGMKLDICEKMTK